ncbi:hypothetical protein [Methanimicrococcus hongohii]|uniref:hypothetical protein n=1 Tax=Methanimicrococcus hongohii TaxID=3028295 RepID=UPI00292E2E22|nr:hypothetical protein [Methanimicrococcus sp. Hf6]
MVLLIAVSAITPALAVSNAQNSSNDVKFVKFKIMDDAQWENMTDEEKEAFDTRFEIIEENGGIRVTMARSDVDESDAEFKIRIEKHKPVDMNLLEAMSAEERESYVLTGYKEQLDIEVEAGNLTQAEADEMYEAYKANPMAAACIIGSGIRMTALTAEELESLKDMTDDEKEAFFSEHLKTVLDEAVASGKMTQAEADEILENGISAHDGVMVQGNGTSFSIKMMAPLSEEEIETLQEMTSDEKQEFFLSQIKSSLDADVAAGRITQDEADEIYAHHESGSAGYTKGDRSHKTVSFKINEAITAE